jgi:hypothetical protein
MPIVNAGPYGRSSRTSQYGTPYVPAERLNDLYKK